MENKLLTQLAIEVRKMRVQQKKYFSSRSQSVLIECKKLEFKVDELLKQIPEKEVAQQSGMFNDYKFPDPYDTLTGNFKPH